MPLHVDMRPKTFPDMVGNNAVIESLHKIVARKDRPHAYLFVGPSGTGKTTLARIFAKELGCLDIDFYEYNTANTRGIDTIRDIQAKANLLPHGKVKFYLLDECHQVTGAAAEAMLKMLEDTPSHCYFVLATTNPEKLIPTIKTRVTTFETKLLVSFEMKALLVKCLSTIGNPDNFSPKIITEIIKSANGCPREAVKLLDQVIDMDSEEAALSVVKSFHQESPEIIDLCRAIFDPAKQGFEKWNTCKAIAAKLLESGEDIEGIRRSILGYMSTIFVKAKTPAGAEKMFNILNDFEKPYYSSGKAGLWISIYIGCHR
jgi:DNA polymerase III gamma/tau subunit